MVQTVPITVGVSTSIHSLPNETLEAIIKDFASRYQLAELEKTTCRYRPYWQDALTPLLRVCKLWCAVAEKILYRRLSVGASITHQDFPAGYEGRGEVVSQRGGLVTVVYTLTDIDIPPSRIQPGHEMVKQLLDTLTANSRLAMLVKELRVTVENLNKAHSREWTRNCIRLIKVCPHVQHLDINCFHPSESESLAEVLKQKSLVSFCLTSPWRDNSSLNLFELHRWSRLRTLKLDGEGISHATLNVSDTHDASGALICCPNLQEIHINHGTPHVNVLDSLRVMTRGVVSLSITASDVDEAWMKALGRCLYAWSPTLRRVKLCTLRSPHDHSIAVELSTLQKLWALQLNGTFTAYDNLADLPRLKLLVFTPSRSLGSIADEDMGKFIALLRNKEKFPSLGYLFMRMNSARRHYEMYDVCDGQGIQLKTRWDEDCTPCFPRW